MGRTRFVQREDMVIRASTSRQQLTGLDQEQVSQRTEVYKVVNMNK